MVSCSPQVSFNMQCLLKKIRSDKQVSDLEMMTSTRAAGDREKAFIADALRRLRNHFNIWDHYEGREYQLIGFALYEGCYRDAASGRIIVETAPFALGEELVNYYGFEWVVFDRRYEIATYGVQHPNIDGPIDVFTLEDGGWYKEDDDLNDPPAPGDKTYYSFEPILKAAGLRIRPDR